jgi:hypothetical protein
LFQCKKIPENPTILHFNRDIDVGIFPGISSDVAPEESDSFHAELLSHFFFVGFQKL